jgi:hypothetical protein
MLPAEYLYLGDGLSTGAVTIKVLPSLQLKPSSFSAFHTALFAFFSHPPSL